MPVWPMGSQPSAGFASMQNVWASTRTASPRVAARPAAMLPLSVRLDDTTSMSEALPLSGAEAFEVVVRLSRDGTPGGGPGDWEWRSEVLQVADLSAPVKLDVLLAPGGARES